MNDPRLGSLGMQSADQVDIRGGRVVGLRELRSHNAQLDELVSKDMRADSAAMDLVEAALVEADRVVNYANVFNVEDYLTPKAKRAPGITDEAGGLLALAKDVRDKGGGVIWFPHNADIAIYGPRTTTVIGLLDFTGCQGVKIIGNGSTLISGRKTTAWVTATAYVVDDLVEQAGVVYRCIVAHTSGTFATDLANAKWESQTVALYTIYAPGVTGLHVDGLHFHGGSRLLSSVAGEHFVNWGAGSENVLVMNCEVKDCISGPQCIDDSAKNRGAVVLGCYFERCFYPLSTYCTDDVVARFSSVNGGRAYFPTATNGIGCNNHDIGITSSSGYTSSDCLLAVYAKSGGLENAMRDIRLNYCSPGRQVGSGNAANAIVSLDARQYAASPSFGAAHFADIHVNVMLEGKNVAGSAADFQPWVMEYLKRDFNGANDTAGRGHTYHNITLGGVAMNWDDAAGGVKILDAAAGSGNFSGDFATCLAIRDFVVNGNPASDVIYVDGRAAISGRPFLTIDNVDTPDGTYTEANVTNAYIAFNHFKASNVNAVNRKRTSYTSSWTGAGSNPAIGNGSITADYVKRDRQVRASVKVQPGSTTTFGSGVYALSLPFTAAASGPGWIGSVYAFQSGVNIQSGVCRVDPGGTTMSVAIGDASGSDWAHNAPWTFKNGDYIIATIEYPVD